MGAKLTTSRIGAEELDEIPCDIGGIVYSQSSIILMISHLEARLQPICLRIPYVRPVEEGAEKEEGENWENSMIWLVSIVTLIAKQEDEIYEVVEGYLKSNFNRILRVNAAFSFAVIPSPTVSRSFFSATSTNPSSRSTASSFPVP
jgi:hypothetical protein